MKSLLLVQYDVNPRWVVPSVLATFLAACGPSHEDEVAARRGCELGEQFANAKPVAVEGAPERSAEEQRSLDQLPARVDGFFSGLDHANPTKVKALMSKTCPEQMNNLASALKYHIDHMGLPSPAPKGYGEFLTE
jgi:hypothetical protein